MKLTGRVRHRASTILGATKLVLQVEETEIATYWYGAGVDSEYVTTWRDAKVEDLTVLRTVNPEVA